jgi:hypothetical protein
MKELVGALPCFKKYSLGSKKDYISFVSPKMLELAAKKPY